MKQKQEQGNLSGSNVKQEKRRRRYSKIKFKENVNQRKKRSLRKMNRKKKKC